MPTKDEHETADEEDSEEVDTYDSDELVELPKGACIDVEECSEIQRAHRSRVIAIVGPVAAGKTTIISSIHNLFLKEGNTYSNYEFVRSKTLLSFEKACHYATTASNRSRPATERTNYNKAAFGVLFYQLRIKDIKDGSVLELLLADRTGEEYELLKHGPASPDKQESQINFVEISRADSIAVLVDGKKLLDSAKRNGATMEVIFTIQGIVDLGLICDQSRLIIVLTKSDLIEKAAPDNKAKAKLAFDDLVKKINEKHASVFLKIETSKTAASPDEKSKDTPYGFGIESLLNTWCSWFVPPTTPINGQKPQRAFGRFHHD